MRKIARRTRGTCLLTQPGAELSRAMDRLIANLLAPRLERLTASGQWTVVGNPPALRSGQSALVPFRNAADEADMIKPDDLDLELSFSDGSRRTVRVSVHATASQSPALLAAKAEITALLDAGRDSEAVDTACHHNLLCPGVSFVAVDEAEKVVVATAVLEQPAVEDRAAAQALFRSPAPVCYSIESTSVRVRWSIRQSRRRRL